MIILFYAILAFLLLFVLVSAAIGANILIESLEKDAQSEEQKRHDIHRIAEALDKSKKGE